MGARSTPEDTGLVAITDRSMGVGFFLLFFSFVEFVKFVVSQVGMLDVYSGGLSEEVEI